MNPNIYTDLAIETRELYKEVHHSDSDGIAVENIEHGEYAVHRVKILNEIGAENLGKPIGTYVTIELPGDKSDSSKIISDVSEIVKGEVRNLIGEDTSEPIMVVGLGNSGVTADSLGPQTAEGIQVTRHLFEVIPEDLQAGLREVSSLTPGVLGTTGIETAEIIKAAVEHVKPKAVIAVDSLAGRKMERIANTIQISNTGIAPGAGIGNHRNVLNRESLGVPVIAIGVPTVVSAKTLITDLTGVDGIESYYDNVIVTPKEIDEVIQMNAEIISNGINYALHDDEIFV
ncbi:MAG: GPR endopeptidase [Oscillospiraceae bacterium]|nr:GPR endopeptidase [Oscillospiraceae bacterium]